MTSVNADMVNNFIHEQAKSIGCSKRKERLELLDKIAEKGKELLGDMNATDKEIFEITDEMNISVAEMEQWQRDVENAEHEAQATQDELDDVNAEVEELQAGLDSGVYSEEKEAWARERLDELLGRQSDLTEQNKDKQGNLKSLGDGSKYQAALDKNSARLDELSDNMEEYKEAGNAIKDSANKFGKAHMNCEKTMERNERSWVAAALGGTSEGGTVLGGAAVGAGGTVVGTVAAGAVVGANVAGTAGAVVGAQVAFGVLGAVGAPIVAGGAAVGFVAGAIINSVPSKFEKYVDRMGYEEVGNQTFYDSIDHEYVAEYDVIEAKGGNQISGKMRQATAKVYSYGQTVTTAAEQNKNKIDDVKSKKDGNS